MASKKTVRKFVLAENFDESVVEEYEDVDEFLDNNGCSSGNIFYEVTYKKYVVGVPSYKFTEIK